MKLRLAVLCGGPSLERGISLNSARSACDHLDSDDVEILPIYFDHYKSPYLISRAQLYSNTPSDFDFKLHSAAKPLSKTGFKKFLKGVDMVFPIMHGIFGEDGSIQRFLEKNKAPYIGSSQASCKLCFDKYKSNEVLEKHDFPTIPTLLLKSHVSGHKKKVAPRVAGGDNGLGRPCLGTAPALRLAEPRLGLAVQKFFRKYGISRAVVKPARGGSSIGVYSVNSVKEALAAARLIFTKRMDTRVVVQPFLEGKEFTVIVVQNRFDQPVAMMPTEIEVDYRQNQIFDYRKKYLPSRHVTYHCPPRFGEKPIEQIQIQAEQLFGIFRMRDFARFDGWIMKNGKIIFSDFNPVSGMEQNSFLFQQSTQLGFSHRDFLRMVVKHACERNKIKWLQNNKKSSRRKRKRVDILFGGLTAERQVSVMTGTNAWLKLRRFSEYDVRPFLMETTGKVWELPYYLTLNHTAEEIVGACKRAIANRDLLEKMRKRILIKLSLRKGEANEKVFLPHHITLANFIKQSKFVFLGLHGGIGENGELQKILEREGKFFNGPGPAASRLCINKFETLNKLSRLEEEGIFVTPHKFVELRIFKKFSGGDYIKFWKSLKRELSARTIIVKPHNDGCSAGVVRLFTSTDLKNYVGFLRSKTPHIEANSFPKQSNMVDMPTGTMDSILLEKFIETDEVKVIKEHLIWRRKSGWIEITAGVVGNKKTLHAMNPSLTVAFGEVLSLEEKFQGGTGINITPPPEKYVKKKILELAKKRITKVAKILGIEGYSRIDAFLNIYTGDICVIEANTLPALTPSTVIFHQALVETPKMYPSQFLRKIVELGYERY